jgi:hypothetical protein
MIRKSWLLCVLLGALAWGQAAPGTPAPQEQPAPAAQEKKPEPPKQAKPEDVPANAPVITVIGVCPPAPKPAATAAKGTAAKPATPAKSATKPADCKTVYTKAEFEKLANSLSPNPPATPQLKKQLAGVLPRLIALSAEARKDGMDKTEDYKETLKFVQMQVLTNKLTQKVQREAADVPETEIEAYYKANPAAYEQFNIDRLFVPRTKTEQEPQEKEDDEKLTDEQKKAKEEAEKAKQDANAAAMDKLATDLRDRAAAGEDMVKLQKEAFEAAGMKVENPTVNLPSVRRTGLPQGHAEVFDLKPGEVSKVISDNGGHYIYKVNSKTEMTLDQAKNEIQNRLKNDRQREKMDKLNNSFKSETNEAYFGPGGAGPMPPPRGPRPRVPLPQGQGSQPPARPAQPQNQPPAQTPPPAKDPD